ncbi:hypothetical protein HAPAU_19670 [Halalkalicoccus paucihalophilus]|uniref:Uncharacterized protein n=1 Tax=Halalkalicoccus paucihalophilus TaxID=1008153 RepID=A0A151AD48_9EURY|nr:hypothetical protein HAPAU_19670 [Halalkalicoccus paucihalophilus]
MAASDWHDGLIETLSTTMSDTVRSYRYMEMPVARYR